MRPFVRLLVLGTAVLIAACGGASSSGSTNAQAYKGKTIHLGAILSLTGPGAVYAVGSRDGMNLAVEQINASGGVNGAKIDLTIEDDASLKPQSGQIAQSLIQAGQIVGLLGPTLSNSAVAAQPEAEALKTPIVGISNTGLHIVPDCNYPKETPCQYVFRDSLGEATAVPDNIQAYARMHHPKTGVLLVARDDKFSSDGGTIVQDAAPKNGIQILQTITFSKNDADLTTPVTQAVGLHPDVIFITSLGGIPARIMIQARQLGFTGAFLGGNGFNTAVVSKQAGASGKGAQSGSAWYINNTFASNANFVTAFRQKYGRDPDQFAAQGYAGIQIYAAAARLANLTFSNVQTDRSHLRDALEKVNIQTPLGQFQFTSGHDVHQTVWIVQMDGNGGFSLVTSVKP